MPAEGNIDRIILDAFFPQRPRGVLVEVGAALPDYLSISATFRSLDWKVISIEPNPDFCAAHRAIGHAVLEYACSDEETDNAEFFVVDSKGADYMGGAVSFESFSSLGIKDEFTGLYETVKAKTSMKTISVKVRKLDTILATHEPGLAEFDVLAVDVEGWELNVLRGLSLEKYRPKVAILENVFRNPEYTAYMQSRGYELWKSIEPNEIYVPSAAMASLVRTGFAGLVDRMKSVQRRIGRRN